MLEVRIDMLPGGTVALFPLRLGTEFAARDEAITGNPLGLEPGDLLVSENTGDDKAAAAAAFEGDEAAVFAPLDPHIACVTEGEKPGIDPSGDTTEINERIRMDTTPARSSPVDAAIEVHPGTVGEGAEFAAVIIGAFADAEGIIGCDMDDGGKECIGDVCPGVEGGKKEQNDRYDFHGNSLSPHPALPNLRSGIRMQGAIH